jgi:hypothetical protein
MFPVGSWVKLKVCPDAQPGQVKGTTGARILVRWDDLNYLGSHRAASLELIGGNGNDCETREL